MIDTTLSLIDRFIKFIEVKDKNNEKYFNNFVEPIYKDAESVVSDYTNLFIELIEIINRNEEVLDIIEWLEKRRLASLHIRVKLRAFLGKIDLKQKKSIEESMDKFQKGIWGLLRGGLSIAEEGRVNIPEYGVEGHTVLDLLYIYSQESLNNNREKYLTKAKIQMNCIALAWGDAVNGYAELKNKFLQNI